MKRLMMLAAWAGVLCLGQEAPVAGVFRDGAGALRVLKGVDGAWVAPVAVPEGVVSAGSNGRWLWYKTQNELRVRGPRDGWAAVAAPAGAAAAVFARDGRLTGFVFPEAGLAAEWREEAMALDEARTWSSDAGDPMPEEQVGEDLYLVRRDGAILVRRAGLEPVLIPLAETVTFQLFQRNGETETAVGAALTLPAAAPGETSEARFRLRNPTTAPVLISRLSVDPGAFRIFDQFFPPRYVEPGGFADFAVRFAPAAAGTFTTTLWVNDLKVALTATSEAAPVVEIETLAGMRVFGAGETADLGSVERRATLRRAVRVTPAVALKVEGEGFALQPGNKEGEAWVVVSSDKPGAAQGTLDAGGRVFRLRAVVTDFPTPRPSIVTVSEWKTAGQAKLKVRLSEAARTAYLATLTLEFTPDAGLPDDAAVAFLPQAARTLSVRFAEGESESKEIVFQTGTTAGLIRLRAALGSNTEEKSVRIQPEPVAVTATRALAASAAAEVTVTGFDTTRTVSRVAFTFYLKNGQTAAPGRVEADVASAFSTYFKTVTGGAFALRANFPVSGTFSELEGVEVEIVNSAGTARTTRLRFE